MRAKFATQNFSDLLLTIVKRLDYLEKQNFELKRRVEEMERKDREKQLHVDGERESRANIGARR